LHLIVARDSWARGEEYEAHINHLSVAGCSRAMKRSNHWPKIEKFKWFDYLGTLGRTKNLFYLFLYYAASRRYTISAIFLFLFLVSSGNNEPKAGIMYIKVKK
jgi:hypothetical protein